MQHRYPNKIATPTAKWGSPLHAPHILVGFLKKINENHTGGVHIEVEARYVKSASVRPFGWGSQANDLCLGFSETGYHPISVQNKMDIIKMNETNHSTRIKLPLKP